MGQHLSNINSKVFDSIKTDDAEFNVDMIESRSGNENIHLLSCIKPLDGVITSSVGFDQIANAHNQLIKEIQEGSSLSTCRADIMNINSDINTIFVNDVFSSVSMSCQEIIEKMTAIINNYEQLRLNIFVKQRAEENEHVDQLVSVESFDDTFSENIEICENDDTNNNDNILESNIEHDKFYTRQMSYFSLKSLTSLSLVLIKSAEKNDPNIVHELLTLATQLCDQIPINSLNSSELLPIIDNHWFKSLQPLINYINELSYSENMITASKAIQILLSFSIARASFKDILPILKRLIFNQSQIYNARNLIIRLNDILIKTFHKLKKKEQEHNNDLVILNKTIDYLKTLGVFPNSRCIRIHEKEFTGPLVVSIILAHIDFYNRTHSIEQLKNNSVESSISFEFHPDTFEQLFDIIQQLAITKPNDSNIVICHILTVCIRLFTTHMQFLCCVMPTLDKDFFLINNQWIKFVQDTSTKSDFTVDLSRFSNDEKFKQWFDVLLELTVHDDQQCLERIEICREASKALIYIVERKTSSFCEKLLFFYTCVTENRYPLLVEQIFFELKKKIIILTWIEILMNDDTNTSDKTIASTVLHSFIDICFNPSNKPDLKTKEQIKSMLFLFQDILLIRFISPSPIQTILHSVSTSLESPEFSISHSSISLVIDYITRILNICTDHDFLDSIFVGLYLLMKTDNSIDFNRIQEIFTAILPILTEYFLKNSINYEYETNNIYSICWLIGKISNFMIIGSERNPSELQHIDKLNSSLFDGGCEQRIIEKNTYLSDLYKSNLVRYSQFKMDNQMQRLSSLDDEFLMSIYNNTGQGAQLILKMKQHIEDKQHLLKSIEQQANDACAALFAVYIKHYRRIDLAKKELLRTDNKKPHIKLLSIYELANDVKILFVQKKAQDGDSDELFRHIKMTTEFLILYVKESNLMLIIDEDDNNASLPILINTQPTKRVSFKRQISRWTKAKYVLRLLRNTIQACSRFKKLILAKKQTKELYSIENKFNRLIDTFVYGDYYNCTTLTTNENKILELDELSQCLSRCYERAMTRLITYRFIYKFIENLLEIQDQQRVLTFLYLYLPHLRMSDLEWSYLENIRATNNNIKEEISRTYYSIIKMIFSFTLQIKALKPNLLIENMFSLINLSYESTDIICLNQDQFIETLFISFVSFTKESNLMMSLDTKLTVYNWFRFYVFKLCENIEQDKIQSTSNKIVEKQEQIVFNVLILNELKALKQLQQNLSIDVESELNTSIETDKYSLNNAAIHWFIKAVTSPIENNTSIRLSSKIDIELCTNQFLIILLRCISLYDNVRSICSTIDYIEELLYIYRNNRNHITTLLALKILRYLIPQLPESEQTMIMMKNLFDEILLSIAKNNSNRSNITLQITNELINVYRAIISSKSPWQSIAIELIFNHIISCVNEIKIKSLNIVDNMEMKYIFASLTILGGYIPSYCLGSIVHVYLNKDSYEFDQAIIINMNSNDQSFPYCIQYLLTNQTEWIAIDKLRIPIDFLPSNLFISVNNNKTNLNIDSLIDALGYIIQIDTTTTTESLIVLELKRRSMSTLDYLLNDEKLVEIFMTKSYASIIAKLSMYDSLIRTHTLPIDLRLFNQQHLEQYYLSLDTCLSSNEIIEVENDSLTNHSNDETSEDMITLKNVTDTSWKIWHHDEFHTDPLIINALSMSAVKYNGWKPYASKSEIESFGKGRIGDNEMSIVSLPRSTIDKSILEECGDKHRFNGSLNLSTNRIFGMFPTLILDNVQLTQGKWYYCVRLPISGIVQIGWATTGFTTSVSNRGVGDDEYSWSYDGSTGVLYNNGKFSYSSEEICWKENDVCGCGIEIDGENTRIKYWLNGKFLGTFFENQVNIGTSTKKCNMLPHGHATPYFPAVSLHIAWLGISRVEFIFSPEDMSQCPLPPNGYQPLLMPKLATIENSIVPYPYRAYLVSYDNLENYVHPRRSTNATNILFDFINEYHHLDTSFNLDNNHLLLPQDSSGFPLTIDNEQSSSLTLSFDFEIILNDNIEDEQSDFILFTLDTTEIFSVRIPRNKLVHRIQTAIVLNSKEKQIKIYMNNICQTIDSPIEIQTMTKFNFHILPNIHARIQNIAMWKYALDEDYIRRLFTYKLFYIAVDYKNLNEYRHQVNTFRFNRNQRQFNDELLLPFDESFDENLWEEKKKQVSMDEWKYFKILDETDESTINLFGNKTYLVVSKSIESWSEYTLILDIYIPNLPKVDEHLTIFSANVESGIYITHNGRICLLKDGKANHSKNKCKFNEYMRLIIIVQQKYIDIYLNGILQIRGNIDNDQFILKTNRFHLFEEIDLQMNTTADDTVRLECKSITFLNHLLEVETMNEQMKLANYSLASLTTPRFSLIATNLIAIGYQDEWIKLAMRKYNTTHSQSINTILREKRDEFLKLDHETKQNYHLTILSRLNPSIEPEHMSELNNDEEGKVIGQFICDHENTLTISESSNDSITIGYIDINELNENREEKNEKDWYQQTVRGLDVPDSIIGWLNDKSLQTDSDTFYQLFDLEKSEQTLKNEIFDRRTTIHKSTYYIHQHISRKQYVSSRAACEHGLISIYARNIILHVLKVWSNNVSNLFSLKKLGDYSFIVKLFQLLDYHYTHRSTYINENIDRITELIYSILQIEIKELFKHTSFHQTLTIKLLQNHAPLLYELKKDIITQWIRFLLKPVSRLYENDDKASICTEEEILTQQLNWNFILKILKIFVKLATDKTMKQNEIDFFVPILFRTSFINIMFDLFLLVPDYQSKIFVLRQFITLIRVNKTINLNTRSQNFIIHLLIELSISTTIVVSPITQALKTALMDLAVHFLQKRHANNSNTIEQSCVKFKMPRFPKQILDVFRVVNMIDVLIKNRQEQEYFKKVFEQSHTILGQNLKITEDDFQSLYTLFNTDTDLQLISLMNDHPSINESLDDFISALPNELSTDSTFYKNYPLLSNIPKKYIQIRATIFYQFNMLIERIISIFDLSLLPGQSILVDHIRIIKHYILQNNKFKWFDESLSKTSHSPIAELPEVKFDTIKASIHENNGKNTIFNQAFEQLHEGAHVIFRLSNERLWRATYLNMHSIDQGGPYRDSITTMCSDLCSKRLPLFILCPNGQMNIGLNRDCWIPNVFPPNKPIVNKIKKQYQFIGQLMGMAIRKKHYLNLKFPPLLWKQLVGEDITLNDIEAIDKQSFAIINEMEINIQQNQSIDMDNDMNYFCTSIMSELRFDVISSSGQTYELIPDGQDVPVTLENFPDYCNLYRKYRLNEFQRQIEYIRQGLCSIVPYDFLTLYTANELEQAICGKNQIDISLLKRNTIYRGNYNENSPHIQRFWTVLNEMFDEKQKELFLIFVWGRSTLPKLDVDFTTKFIIQTISNNNNHEMDQMLPRSHTCFFMLDLPEYSTTDVMYERLNYAITNCSSIDGDGMVDDAINPVNLNNDTAFVGQLPTVLVTLAGTNSSFT